MLQLSIVHRLPQHFRWASDHHSAIAYDVTTLDEQHFVALRLISHDGIPAWVMLRLLSEVLADIRVVCQEAEGDGEACLFIRRRAECAANSC
ncbi:MAG TPA: hypothetical protein DCL47_00905, partial [Pantoea agglomerans]|nr:hypothetical protein [Pantoea agglomerans]